MQLVIRPATLSEMPALNQLIEQSARALSVGFYTPAEIDVAVAEVFGVDSELVADRSYFTVEKDGRIVACGGWSRRRTLFGGDRFSGRESGYLDPAVDAAKIRAFFVHPDVARQGIGSRLLFHCEGEAKRFGFTRAEMMATLPGIKLYERYGYQPIEEYFHIGQNGTRVKAVRMGKPLL